MSVNCNATYTKYGATFADSETAYADKNSLFPTELTQSIQDCYDTMLANGVLLESVSHEWDQSTYTLTVVKVVSSREAYQDAVTFDIQATIDYAAAAGWTFVVNPA
jgi:hypothetical protein